MTKITSAIILTLILACYVLSSFYINTVKADATFSVRIIDSMTGEDLNGINLKATWGSNMENQRTTFSDMGTVVLENIDNNYAGDILLSATDDTGRYVAKNELVHVAFQEWVTTTANAELKLERAKPLSSSYSGTYIKSFIQDRDVLYYQETAYIVLGLVYPYGTAVINVQVPDTMRVYGAGVIPMEGSSSKNVVIRIQNNQYSHFSERITGNISLLESYTYSVLETVPITLSIEPSWGYDPTTLSVKLIDAVSKESLSGRVMAWWGSNFNNFEVGWVNSGGQATFNLGAYPNGKVMLKIEDAYGYYYSTTKEVVMTENSIITTVELERNQNYPQDTSPSVNPWVWVGIVSLLLGLAIVGFTVYKSRKKHS